MRRVTTGLMLLVALVAGACAGGDGGGSADSGSAPASGSGGQARSSKQSAAPKALVDSIPSLFAADPKPAENTFVGRASGSRAYLGLVVRGGEAAVYVCDGTNSEWFGGRLNGDKLDLQTENGTKLTATMAAGNITGTLTFGPGPARDFVASPPTGVGPGLFAATGLFRTRHKVGNDDYLTGWIILPDGVRGTTSKEGQTDGFALDPSADPGETLRRQLPVPGAARPRNFEAFAGRDDANTVRVGFVRDTTSGGAVAFVTNGVDQGVWLTGTMSDERGRLAAPDGSELAVTVDAPTATLEGMVGGRRVQARAEAAGTTAAGLFRSVDLASDRTPVEFGEIVLNDATVSGVASSGGAVFFSAQVEKDEPATSDGLITDSSGRTPSGDQPFLFKGWRCSMIKLRWTQYVKLMGGTGADQPPDQLAYVNGLEQRYESMGCEERTGPIGGAL